MATKMRRCSCAPNPRSPNYNTPQLCQSSSMVSLLLGVILDNNLSFAPDIQNITQAKFFRLCISSSWPSSSSHCLIWPTVKSLDNHWFIEQTRSSEIIAERQNAIVYTLKYSISLGVCHISFSIPPVAVDTPLIVTLDNQWGILFIVVLNFNLLAHFSIFFVIYVYVFKFLLAKVMYVCKTTGWGGGVVDKVPGGWITPLHALGQAALVGITVRPAPWLD